MQKYEQNPTSLNLCHMYWRGVRELEFEPNCIKCSVLAKECSSPVLQLPLEK